MVIFQLLLTALSAVFSAEKLNQSTQKNPPVRVGIFYYGNKNTAFGGNYRPVIKGRGML